MKIIYIITFLCMLMGCEGEKKTFKITSLNNYNVILDKNKELVIIPTLLKETKENIKWPLKLKSKDIIYMLYNENYDRLKYYKNYVNISIIEILFIKNGNYKKKNKVVLRLTEDNKFIYNVLKNNGFKINKI